VGDRIDKVLEQWAHTLPELDTSGLEVTARVLRAARLIEQQHEEVFGRFDLTRGEFDVVVSLLRSGTPHQLTPSALSTALLLSTSAMTNRIDRLEEAGLVARQPDRSDRRVVIVGLTAKGRKLAARAMEAHAAHERELVSGLTDRERASLVGALSALLQQLERTERAPEPVTSGDSRG
jgi:DNA-binding MarR family transcriptional regulator